MRQRTLLRIGSIGMLVLLFGTLVVLAFRAPVAALRSDAPASTNHAEALSTPLPWAQPRLVRVEFADQRAIDRLAGEFDVWEVHHAQQPKTGGWALLQVDSADLASLRLEGYAPVDAHAVGAASAEGFSCGGGPTIADFPCYRTVAKTDADLTQLVATHPTLARLVKIGESWEKATAGGGDGNDMQVLVVTNQESTFPKFRFFLMGAIHARELATAETAMRFAEMLVSGYGSHPEITWLLDHGEAHILVNSNPDGRLKAESGYCWRKNTNDTDGSCAIGFGNGPGIDLNRNFAFQWGVCTAAGCSSTNACSAVFRGIAPASEPEVDAIQAYLAAIFSDVRGDELTGAAPLDASGMAISLHSYGELVLFPWGFTNTFSPNAAQLQTLADKMGFYTGYRACAAGANGCLYKTDGTTDDWLYGELGTAAFTIEMGTAFFQSCGTYEAFMVDDLLATLLYAFKAARQPYTTPFGPEPVNVALSSSVVVQGDPFTITASLDTTRFDDNGGRPDGLVLTPTTVATATWFLDLPSWITDSAGIPMQAVDGDFDGAVEQAEAEIDSTALSLGRHLLFVEGAGNLGQSGVPAAVFLDVVDTPPPAPTPAARLYVPGVKNGGE